MKRFKKYDKRKLKNEKELKEILGFDENEDFSYSMWLEELVNYPENLRRELISIAIKLILHNFFSNALYPDKRRVDAILRKYIINFNEFPKKSKEKILKSSNLISIDHPIHYLGEKDEINYKRMMKSRTYKKEIGEFNKIFQDVMIYAYMNNPKAKKKEIESFEEFKKNIISCFLQKPKKVLLYDRQLSIYKKNLSNKNFKKLKFYYDDINEANTGLSLNVRKLNSPETYLEILFLIYKAKGNNAKSEENDEI